MTHLIFTADDAGVVKEIDNAIIDLVNMGLINSAEVLPNYITSINNQHYYHGVHNAKRILNETAASGNPLELGIHLTITSGSPISNPSGLNEILDEQGRFISFHELPSNANKTNLYNELKMQAEILLSDNTLKPHITHITNHHDALWFYPKYTEVLVDLAEELKLPIRSPKVMPKFKSQVYYVTKNKYKLGTSERMNKNDRKQIESAYLLRKENKFPDKEIKFKSCDYLDSSVYHILSQLLTTQGRELDQSVKKVRKKIISMIKDAAENAKIVEFMFHVYKDAFANIAGFDGSDLNYYNGISTNYFDGRIIEYLALSSNKEAILLEMAKQNCVMSGWQHTKSKKMDRA